MCTIMSYYNVYYNELTRENENLQDYVYYNELTIYKTMCTIMS